MMMGMMHWPGQGLSDMNYPASVGLCKRKRTDRALHFGRSDPCDPYGLIEMSQGLLLAKRAQLVPLASRRRCPLKNLNCHSYMKT